MGVYIKGMEMPSCCLVCPCSGTDITDDSNEVWVCEVNELRQLTTEDKIERRPEWCPLVPVPPHGRLGDLDKLENGLRHMAKYQYGERQQGILGCCETIRLAHTIIPAEPFNDLSKPFKEEGE